MKSWLVLGLLLFKAAFALCQDEQPSVFIKAGKLFDSKEGKLLEGQIV